MKYYLIAGETSGDLHASNLMAALRLLDPVAEFRFWGGARMEAQGGTLVNHYRDISYMGFWEVAKNAGKLTRFMKRCREDIRAWKPDVLVPIDSPGFNLRMSKFASRSGIAVCYYISPQVWAWKSSRVKIIKRHVDRMITILPFEKEFDARYGVEVDYVGHPLLDAINTTPPPQSSGEKPIIALLPGSRSQEVSSTLPVMAEVAQHFPKYSFIVCGVSTIDEALYRQLIAGRAIELVIDQTQQILGRAHAALVTSGTATLEAALLNVPQVVGYKGGAISYFIGRRLVKVDFIALVNLIMGKEVVKELIQRNLSATRLKNELSHILEGASRESMLEAYVELRKNSEAPGASQRAASIVYDVARKAIP